MPDTAEQRTVADDRQAEWDFDLLLQVPEHP